LTSPAAPLMSLYNWHPFFTAATAALAAASRVSGSIYASYNLFNAHKL